MGSNPYEDGQLEDRRRHPRRKVRMPARLLLVGYVVGGLLEDIAEGGVKFTTEDPHIIVEAGNFVSVSFDCKLDGQSATIQRSVRVLRVETRQEDDRELRVFGLEFDELFDLQGVEFSA